MTTLNKFKNDIQSHILSTLPRDPSDDAELAAMDTASLLITYINWSRRIPPWRPRHVLESAEIIANPLRTSTDYGARYVDLIEKIKRGDDLTERLSRRIGIGYKTPTTPGRFNKNREDLDLLLNDWDVHHLHFDATGTEMLVFIQFAGDVAFLINIYDHSSWTKREIAEIIIENWPASSFVREIPGIIAAPNHSDAERALLRNSGIASLFIPFKGKTYVIGTAGVTSAGTSAFATMQANWLMKTIAEWSSAIHSDPEFMPNKIRAAGRKTESTLDLEFVFMPNHHYGIGERSSGTLFRLTQGPL